MCRHAKQQQDCHYCRLEMIHTVTTSNIGVRLGCYLLLCHYATCPFMVTTLASTLSGISPKLNRVQLSAVCHCGQSSRVIKFLARHCSPLGHPSAASSAYAVVEISPSKQQCSKWQASLKASLQCNIFAGWSNDFLDVLKVIIKELVLLRMLTSHYHM